MNEKSAAFVAAAVVAVVAVLVFAMLAFGVLTATSVLTGWFGIGLILAGVLGAGMLFRRGRR